MDRRRAMTAKTSCSSRCSATVGPKAAGSRGSAKFSPPPGKLIKIVAIALSNEHVFNLEGGRATKSGAPVRASGGYTLNPTGQPHSAMIATETVSLIIYSGEPDRIVSMDVIDVARS